MSVKIQLFEFGLTPLDLCLWGRMKSEVYKEKVNTRDELVARIMNSAAVINQERQDDLRRATPPIAKRVEIALKSTVGFLNTYFELLQFIEIIYIKNKSNQQVICLSFTHFVRRFTRNIQAAVSQHPLKIGRIYLFTRNMPYFHLLIYLLFLLKHSVYVLGSDLIVEL
jgi:hypothetical protein